MLIRLFEESTLHLLEAISYFFYSSRREIFLENIIYLYKYISKYHSYILTFYHLGWASIFIKSFVMVQCVLQVCYWEIMRDNSVNIFNKKYSAVLESRCNAFAIGMTNLFAVKACCKVQLLRTLVLSIFRAISLDKSEIDGYSFIATFLTACEGVFC